MYNYNSGGFMPEMVQVGISNDKNRLRDLTTSTITTNYGVPFNEENGKAENFGNFRNSKTKYVNKALELSGNEYYKMRIEELKKKNN